jgi:PAS domain S-box-containing protein
MKNTQFEFNSQMTDALLCNQSACIKVLDAKGKLEYLSPKGIELLELNDPQSIIGSEWVSFWESNADSQAAKLALDVALAGGVGSFEGFYQTEQGTPKWWDVTTVLIHNGSGTSNKILVISKEVTDRKNLEARLKESNQKLAQTVDQLHSERQKLSSTESMLDSLLRQSHS